MSDSLFAVNFEFQPRPVADQDLAFAFAFAIRFLSDAVLPFIAQRSFSQPPAKVFPPKKQLDDVALS